MENTDKQKAIEAAYGEYWEKMKPFINEDGWCLNRKVGGYHNQLEISQTQYHPTSRYWFRPKSLAGIENNNGWIKIESEADLPKIYTECHIRHTKDGDIEIGAYAPHRMMFAGVDSDYEIKYISHYQPITKPQPPIF